MWHLDAMNPPLVNIGLRIKGHKTPPPLPVRTHTHTHTEVQQPQIKTYL